MQVETTQVAQEGRERNFTGKGKQYFCSLKRKAALEGKKEFLHELSDFETRIAEFHDITEINKLVTSLSIKMNSVTKALNEWLELSTEKDEIHEAIDIRKVLSERLMRIQNRAREYVAKLSVQKDEIISTTSR